MGGQDLRLSSSSASERRQWQRIFETLVEMLQSQKSQIQTLVGDRKFLEDYVNIQHDRWCSKIHLLESHISQMTKFVEKGRRVEVAKLDLMLGLKQREASFYKEQCECTDKDLDDFHELVESLSHQISELKEKSKDKKSKEDGEGKRIDCDLTDVGNSGEKDAVLREGEMRKLKQAYKKLKCKKEMEVSSLLAEKDFVWNQFKKMESDYIGLLKSKRIEVEQANEAIEKLQQNLENLQSSAIEKDQMIAGLKSDLGLLEKELRRHTEEAEQANDKAEKLQLDMQELWTSANNKDETIAQLKNDLSKLEMDMRRHNNVKSRLANESLSLRNSKMSSRTVAGSHPRVDSQKHRVKRGSRSVARMPLRVYNELDGSHSDTINGCRNGSKRKGRETISAFESPTLFSANFKVPKLKNFSPAVVR